MSIFMAKESNQNSGEIAPKEVRIPGTKEIILVDKEGNETYTTHAFYEKQKDNFKNIGLSPKQ